MNREQAKIYLRSSGFSEEQINTIEQAFKQEPCEDAISRQNVDDLFQQAIESKSANLAEYWKKIIWVREHIKDLPSVTCSEKPQECEDAISRQDAIGIIQNWLNFDTGYSWGEKNVMKCAISELMDLPSVSTEKTGRWELVYRDCGIEYYLCSKCHEGKVAIDGDYYKNITEFIYCPSCGCFMKGVEE